MANKDFFKQLNKLCKQLNEQYNINDGYCYYIAYLIAKFCEKNKIEYHFVEYKVPFGGIYHYGVIVGDVMINPDWSDTQYYSIHYIKQDSKWMYNQHKQNYKPKLCYYWKDYYKRYVNSEIKAQLKKYNENN